MRSIYQTLFALAALCCAGCASSPKVELNWNGSVKTVYRMTREPFPIDLELDVDRMLTKPEEMQAMVAKFKALKIDPPTLPMRLTLEGDAEGRIELLARNAEIDSVTEAADESERFLGEMREKTVGLVQLNTAINRHGENLTPYLKSGQSNLVKMLSWLPEHPVAVGERWRLPLVLTSLNTPFLADETQRDNKVWVNAINQRPGVGGVAEIVYLVREKIEGHRQLSIKETAKPFKFESTYFAVGEFALAEHRWLRYAGRLDVAAMGMFRTVDLIALMPENEANR